MCMALAAERERESLGVGQWNVIYELNTQTPSDWRAVRIC